ncbi:MAG: flagellar biosynthesis anti-sigma factor FlgM [Planctomycetota bacterium]
MSEVTSLGPNTSGLNTSGLSANGPGASGASNLDATRVASAPGRLGDDAGRPVEVDARPDLRPSDRVEVSPIAQYLARLREEPGIRQDVVDQVSAEIESGVYEAGGEFDAKLDTAIDRLIDDLYA